MLLTVCFSYSRRTTPDLGKYRPPLPCHLMMVWGLLDVFTALLLILKHFKLPSVRVKSGLNLCLNIFESFG